MDLRELGAMLREERERQGLSIEDVSDRIKITRSCLSAIEDGNESVLPHPVYARGFIKNYAKLLGVDQEDFSKRLAEVYQLEETPLREVPLVKDLPDDACDCAPTRGRRSAPRPRIPLVPALICLGLVVAVVGLVWYLWTHVFSKSNVVADKAAPVTRTEPAPVKSEPESPPRPVPVVPAQKPVETAPAPQTPAVAETKPAPAPEARPVVETRPQPAPSPDDQVAQDIANSGPATPGAPPAIPPAPEPVAAPGAPAAKTFTVGDTGSHVVTIVANDRCWLQAGADGGAMHETMLEKGDAFTGRFADYMLVRLGNAGAVEIRFDNKLYPLQAGKGSVKTLKFVAKKGEEGAAGKPVAPTSGIAPMPAPVAVATPAPAAPAVATSPAPAAPAAGGETVQQSGGREVEIYGQDGSWVIVTPDKGPAKEIYVKKGQRLTVPFGERIDIKLGNPSNVVFRYDGKETAVVTEKGESKSIRFP